MLESQEGLTKRPIAVETPTITLAWRGLRSIALALLACAAVIGLSKEAIAQDISALQVNFGTIPSATLPIDGHIKHRFNVTNGGAVALSLSISANVLEINQAVPVFPQPSQLTLEPGKSITVTLILDSANGNIMKLPVGDNIRTVAYTFQVGSQTLVKNVVYSITVLPTNWSGGGPQTISGSVVDSNGAPIRGALVQVATPDMLMPLSINTGTSGAFSFSVPTRTTWMITASQPGYAKAQAFASPSSSAPYTLSLSPASQGNTPTITLSKSIQGSIGFWQGASAADGQLILLSNGQEIWQDPSLKPQSRLYLYRIDGTKVWEYPMGDEAWGMSVSRDGSYAAYVTRPALFTSAPTIGLLNAATGTPIWQETMAAPTFQFTGWVNLSSQEVRISNSNRYLAVGTGEGYAYMLDLASGRVLWSKFLGGMVRNIRFSVDDSATYLGSDPWLVKVDSATGSEIWRANIFSWPLSDGLKLSPDGTSIAAMVKTGDVSVVRTSDGSVLWTYDAGTIGQFLAYSADGSRIAAAPFGALWVFDAATGNLIWRVSPPAKDAAFSPDGSLFAFQTLYSPSYQLLVGPMSNFNPNPVGQFSFVSPDGTTLVAAQGQMSQPGTAIAFYTVRPSLAVTAPYTGLWWNPNESGWGMSITQHGSMIFAVPYTYEATGQPEWYVMSSCAVSANTCSGTLYKVTGGTSPSVPWNGSALSVTNAGTGTLTFADANNGTFSFTLNNVAGSKSITRQLFAAGTAAPPVNYTDLWWNVSESGWGVAITQENSMIFATWYSYDSGGKPVWSVASSCPVSGNGCTGDLYQVNGGSPLTSAWNGQIVATKVGTVTFAFIDAYSGTMSYTVNGVTGSRTITRQSF